MSKNNVVPEELSSVDKVLNDPKLLMRAFEFIANRIEEMEKEEDRASGYQIHYIGPWRIVVDNKSDLLPDEVLRKTRTDILVFAGGRGSQAGIFFRPDNEVVHWAFNLDGACTDSSLRGASRGSCLTGTAYSVAARMSRRANSSGTSREVSTWEEVARNSHRPGRTRQQDHFHQPALRSS